MPILADGLGGLQQVLELRQLGVGIAVIHQGVQQLDGFPDPHALVVELQILFLLRLDELQGLVGVIEPIELFHSGASLGPIVAKGLAGALAPARIRGLSLGIPAGHELIPIIEPFARLAILPLPFDSRHELSPRNKAIQARSILAEPAGGIETIPPADFSCGMWLDAVRAVSPGGDSHNRQLPGLTR